ncbi:hypothetical protein FB451DRAFT_1176731 [Mycena latifolia]|nr:hypothetical protein FB451DRAFT_1176731 [Mycena latifolia]
MLFVLNHPPSLTVGLHPPPLVPTEISSAGLLQQHAPWLLPVSRFEFGGTINGSPASQGVSNYFPPVGEEWQLATFFVHILVAEIALYLSLALASGIRVKM